MCIQTIAHSCFNFRSYVIFFYLQQRTIRGNTRRFDAGSLIVVLVDPLCNLVDLKRVTVLVPDVVTEGANVRTRLKPSRQFLGRMWL
jgi:hypothetical protein